MRHDKFLNTAFKIAQEVPRASDHKVAAIVVCKNNVISVGVNQMKTHPMVAKNKHDDWCETLHAETSAIINALRQIGSRKLAKCDLYVCRAKVVDKNYQWGIAKPCANCQEFMEKYPLRSCYYSIEKTGKYEKLE
jgi:cytidine deaminase